MPRYSAGRVNCGQPASSPPNVSFSSDPGSPTTPATSPATPSTPPMPVHPHHSPPRPDEGLRVKPQRGSPHEGHTSRLPMPLVREAAQVVRVELEQAVGHRPADDSLIEGGPEHTRKDGHDVEPHRASSTVSS